MTELSGLTEIPESLREEVAQYWATLQENAPELIAEIAGIPQVVETLGRVWAVSEFVARSVVRAPEMFRSLIEKHDLLNAYPPGDYHRRLTDLVNGVESDEQLGSMLRQFRRREMMRIAWRDIVGWATVEETLEDLSALADAAIQLALQTLERLMREDWGVPFSPEGEEQELLVIGMGKLGARELNYSSDIDLIFTFPEHGQTRGGRERSNEQYFTKLSQRLIKVLNETTAEGFVFRVDMRLRPYGDSGPLVVCIDALEEYYQSQGRDWERYAMIKARVITGSEKHTNLLSAMLRPFIYRRYIDFGAFESIRKMKAMIHRELMRKGISDNIKLGSGGIREVEFIGQAFQLIRGGRVKALQTRGILEVLAILADEDLLPGFAEKELREAYLFLRKVENRLQQFRDEQTHLLPASDLGRARLAYALDYAGWDEFLVVLDKHRSRVHDHFEQVFAAPQAEAEASDGQALVAVWQGVLGEGQARQYLADSGFDDPEEAYRQIGNLIGSREVRSMSRQGRERLDKLMPLLLPAVAVTEQPTACLSRLVPLIETIARRSAYIALLVENPMALSQLVKLSGTSSWISRQLARYPVLLDVLLDPRTLYAPLDVSELERDLRIRLKNFELSDVEEQMDALRHFKQSNVLRVAAADISEAMPLMVVSDHLTAVAEVSLRQSLSVARAHLQTRHGAPCFRVEGETQRAEFAVVAYGKLGGIELGYGSDLDIVFLHNSTGKMQQTDGEKVLENSVYFARVGQRIIHILNTIMPAGMLYEVDTRLRPSGESGLLVSSLDAFSNYQRNEAWTWEHQALVRARVVAGDQQLVQAFDSIRSEILSRERDDAVLRADVCKMRDRMRESLSTGKGDVFDIKQDRGGIADIEFMVQYAVLKWGHQNHELFRFTDNVRILEALSGAGLLAGTDAELLADAYRDYRKMVHRLKLQDKKAVTDLKAFGDYPHQVAEIWHRMLEQ